MVCPTLDSFDRLVQTQRYQPNFARKRLRVESQNIVNKVQEYLDNLDQVAVNHETFMHLMRLLTQFHDSCISTFEDKQCLCLRLWELVGEYVDLYIYCFMQYQHPDVKGFMKSRIAEALSSTLNRIFASHVPLIWLKSTSRSSHASEEQLKQFGSQIDWKVLLDEIEKRYRRDYRDPVGTSQ